MAIRLSSTETNPNPPLWLKERREERENNFFSFSFEWPERGLSNSPFFFNFLQISTTKSYEIKILFSNNNFTSNFGRKEP